MTKNTSIIVSFLLITSSLFSFTAEEQNAHSRDAFSSLDECDPSFEVCEKPKPKAEVKPNPVKKVVKAPQQTHSADIQESAQIAQAPVQVTKTVSVNHSDYPNTSIKKIKSILLNMAKLEAAGEIFGDFIQSETMVKNGALVSDLITAKRGGIVRVKGSPTYSNGKSIGDIQITITAYATPKDIHDMSAQKIYLKDFYYNNSNLKISELKKAAEDAFIVEALSKKKPSIKNYPNIAKEARKLTTSLVIEEANFDINTQSYKMSGYIEYVPIFLRQKKFGNS